MNSCQNAVNLSADSVIAPAVMPSKQSAVSAKKSLLEHLQEN